MDDLDGAFISAANALEKVRLCAPVFKANGIRPPSLELVVCEDNGEPHVIGLDFYRASFIKTSHARMEALRFIEAATEGVLSAATIMRDACARVGLSYWRISMRIPDIPICDIDDILVSSSVLMHTDGVPLGSAVLPARVVSDLAVPWSGASAFGRDLGAKRLRVNSDAYKSIPFRIFRISLLVNEYPMTVVAASDIEAIVKTMVHVLGKDPDIKNLSRFVDRIKSIESVESFDTREISGWVENI